MDALAPRRIPVRSLNWLLLVPAIVSIAFGARNGMRHSQDFQWSGAHLFAAHIDPFLQQLRHNPGHLIQAVQIPNYLHELYLFLWPLGLLSFPRAAAVWVGINLLFVAAVVVLLGRVFALQRERTVLLGLLLAMSTAFRVTLGNGQQSLLELLLLTLVLVALERARREPSTGAGWFWLGLSYCKYSFSPVFVFFLLFRRRWLMVLLSLIPPAVGWLLFSWWVHRPPLTTAVEPLLVSRTGVGYGDGDVATLLMLLSSHGAGLLLPVTLALSLVLAYAVHRRGLGWREAFAVLAAANLALLPHLTYDYVLLSVPAALLLGETGGHAGRSRLISALLLLVLCYGFKLLPTPHAHAGEIASVLVHMGLLTVLTLSLVEFAGSLRPGRLT